MRVELNYGRGKMPFELPDDWDVRVISKRAMPVIADPAAAMRAAVANPVGAPALAELARGKTSACILILTRSVGEQSALATTPEENPAATLRSADS